MQNSNESNVLAAIEEGAEEILRLIQEHKYNISMIKSRQLLEYMIRYLCDIFGVEDSDMSSMIDTLYSHKIISGDTKDHYHRIRMLGNNALHNNDNNSYNARTSYDLLNIEIDVFADILENSTPTEEAAEPPASPPPASTRHRTEGVGLSNPSGIAAKVNRSRNKSAKKRRTINYIRLGLTLAIPVLIIIIIIGLIFFLRNALGGKGKKNTETTAPTTVAASISEEATTTAAVETTTAAPAPQEYVTTTTVRVRTAPSAESEKIDSLQPGTIIQYIGAYDNNWSIINFNGKQAYIATQYIKPKE